jgi:NADH-quinone oxidoreductase subunit M
MNSVIPLNFEFGGLSSVIPVYAAVFLIITMSSIGLPALNGFIGEFMILMGVFPVNFTWAMIASTGIILGAAYMLWLYQRVMFGKLENPANEGLKDLNLREFATFLPLIIMAFWIGIAPKPFLNVLNKPVEKIIRIVNPDYYTKQALEIKKIETPQHRETKPGETETGTGTHEETIAHGGN